jgi:hypothetical protein
MTGDIALGQERFRLEYEDDYEFVRGRSKGILARPDTNLI